MQGTFGAVYKGRPANGEGWFCNSGRGMVCENLNVRKLLEKLQFQIYSGLKLLEQQY